MPEGAPTARELARASQAAVTAKDRDGWLSLFAADAVVQDPVGPSPLDPDGAGHRGPAAIAAFYDNVIAKSERITFEIERSYLCGDEVADVGVIRTTLTGGRHVAVVRGVYTYRSDGAGKLAALRAFWEFNTLELLPPGDLLASARPRRFGVNGPPTPFFSGRRPIDPIQARRLARPG